MAGGLGARVPASKPASINPMGGIGTPKIGGLPNPMALGGKPPGLGLQKPPGLSGLGGFSGGMNRSTFGAMSGKPLAAIGGDTP